MWKKVIASLNIAGQCKQYRVGLWQCPHFLFIIMGLIIVLAIIASYFTAAYFKAGPEIAIFIVISVTIILFIISHIVVTSFERIAHSSRDKSEFISIMSHQLRSPVSSIKWLLDSINIKENIPVAEPSQDQLQEFKISSVLESVEEQNEKIIQLVNDLLDINRIEDKTIILQPANFYLEGLTRKVIGEHEGFAKASNISLRLEVEENLPSVFADEIRIKSVTRHLIDNAIRYTANKGEIKIKLEKVAGFIKFSVSDQGVGIREKDKKNIFKKFFRSPSVLRYRTEGTGVGLYIVKNIVNLSGGKIGFKSEENKGSVFWFTLPTKK